MSRGLVTLRQMPSSCKTCPFFELILNEPITVNLPHGDEETVVGACRCQLDKLGRRLTPVAPDSEDILEIQPDICKWIEQIRDEETGEVIEEIPRTSATYVSVRYEKRPKWCPIKEVE